MEAAVGEPVEQITELTKGLGADCGVEAIGYQAHDPSGDEHPELVLDNLVKSVRRRLPAAGPRRGDRRGEGGRIAYDYGTFFAKGQQMGTGQAPVKRYNEQLRDLVSSGRATPSFLVSHELPLEKAPEGYQRFEGARPAGRRCCSTRAGQPDGGAAAARGHGG